MFSRRERDFLEDTGFQLLSQVAGFAVCTAFYGIFILLFLVSAYIVIQREVKTRSTWSLFAITLITFSLSTLYWATFLAEIVIIMERTFIHIPAGYGSTFNDWLDGIFGGIVFTENVTVVAPRLLQIFGDIVVIWRAWVLSDRRPLFIALPVVLLVGTCGTSAGFLYLYFTKLDDVRYGDLTNRFFVASGALSAVTNATSTLAIAWRYFNYRRLLRTTKGGFRSRAQSILLLLIESGCIYGVLQITNVLLSSDGIPGTAYNDPYNYATAFFIETYVQTTAMYPTVVVVLIHHKQSLPNSVQTAAPSGSGWSSDTA